MTQIQRADPAARRRALKLLLVGLVLGLILIQLLETALEEQEQWLLDNLPLILENSQLVVVLGIVMALPLAGLSIYLLLFANRIARAERFPPPGVAVTRDTPVIEGAAARRRAWLLRILAMVIFLCGYTLPWVLWSIVDQVTRPACTVDSPACPSRPVDPGDG